MIVETVDFGSIWQGRRIKGKYSKNQVDVETHTLTNWKSKNKPPVPITVTDKFVDVNIFSLLEDEPCIEDEVNLREIVDKSSSNTFVVAIGRKRKCRGAKNPVAVEAHTLTNWTAMDKPQVLPTVKNKFVDVNMYSLIEVLHRR